MATIKLALAKTLAYEGGYVNDPADAGGETIMGVARNMHPKWSGWAIIDKLKTSAHATPALITKAMRDSHMDLIESFYKTQFWDKMRLDELTHQLLAEQLFDIAVNHGVARAGQFLQTCLVTNIDGIIGANTISITNSNKDLPTLNNKIVRRRCEFYWSIWDNKPSQIKFMRGWQTRALGYIIA